MTCASTRSESIDSLLRLLADSCRRTLLNVLVTGPDEQSVDEVVDQVIADSRSGGQLPPDSSRVATELHHKHLPRLDDNDVVDYDAGQNVVRYHQSEDLEALLDSIADLENDAPVDGQ